MMNNYGIFLIVLVSGDGVVVIDVDGRIYIDLFGGIVVNVLGYCYFVVIEVVIWQMLMLGYIFNLYVIELGIVLVEELVVLLGVDQWM